MTRDEAMAELKSLGNEGVRKHNAKNGAGENQFGVKMGDIRTLAKKIKSDHKLALELWETGNLEGRLLATLIIDIKKLTAGDLDKMIRSIGYGHLADWFICYVVKQHSEKESLRKRWMADNDPSAGRAGWSLTTESVTKSPDNLDFTALLDRIEKEMATAPELAKWSMNFCLIDIGIHSPEHRNRAISIGEKIGAYRDYPVSKGCISPFAPIAITELAKRKS